MQLPIASEIPGCFSQPGLVFITELEKRLKLESGDKLELSYLFQRLSNAIGL